MKHGHILGIELNEKICQVSYYDDANQEPHTVEMGSSKYQIPTTIAKEGDGWAFGEAARQCETPITDLLTIARGRKLVQVGEESYEGIWLLSKYLQLVLKHYSNVEAIAFTIPTMDVDIVHILKSIGQKLGVAKENIFVMDYRESFCNYMFHQPRELWQFESALFYCDGIDMRAYRMRKLQTGMVSGNSIFVVVDEVISETMDELQYVYPIVQQEQSKEADLRFSAFVKMVFERKLISSVFLTGDGFEGAWYPESLRTLCNGRRVFQGNNLFSRGACFAAYSKVISHADEYVYLDDTKMTDQIYMRLRIQGKDGWYPIIPWGTRWYEADKQFEVLLEDTQDVEIRIESLFHKDVRVAKIPLEGLVNRARYSLRLQVNFIFADEHTCKIVLKDVGFGSFFQPSGFRKEATIQLGGNHEQFNSMS